MSRSNQWHLGVALLLTVLVAVVTWPQVITMRGVNDFGDPLLNSWILAWDAHALATQPWHIFDANIFAPERNVLAFSETLIVPALIAAPFLWVGLDPVVVHNLVLLGAYVSSGLAMFALVTELTGNRAAALLSAVIFALYPYRTESYPRIQMQIVCWLPLALLYLHRLVRGGNLRDGVKLALAVVLQAYSCMYLAVYGAVMLTVVGAGLLVSRSRAGLAPIARGVAVGALVAVVLVAPLAIQYRRASAIVGERSIDEVRQGSAELGDYRRAHPDNALYGDLDHPGVGERRLFPGYTTLAAAAIGLAAPPAAMVYVSATAVGVNLSLGTNGVGYEWLYRHFYPIRALRVPARLALLVGLTLAVLAGLGVARITRERSRWFTWLAVTGLIATVTVESRNRPLELSRLDEQRPAVYTWLATQPEGIVCEYPVGNLEGRVGPQDPTYQYYSTMHWKPLVNGYSGFEPASYIELKSHLQPWPTANAIAYLQARGVRYLLVHGGFYIRGDYRADVVALRQLPGLTLAGTFRWRDGSETSAFLIANK